MEGWESTALKSSAHRGIAWGLGRVLTHLLCLEIGRTMAASKGNGRIRETSATPQPSAWVKETQGRTATTTGSQLALVQMT